MAVVEGERPVIMCLGTTMVDSLPDPGPWRLVAATLWDGDVVIACSPNHPPIFYRDSKRIEIF